MLKFPNDRIGAVQKNTNLSIWLIGKPKKLEISISNSSEGMSIHLPPEEVIRLRDFLNLWLEERSADS